MPSSSICVNLHVFKSPRVLVFVWNFKGCRMLIMRERFWCSGVRFTWVLGCFYEVLLCWLCDAVAGLWFYTRLWLSFSGIILWNVVFFSARDLFHLNLQDAGFCDHKHFTIWGLARQLTLTECFLVYYASSLAFLVDSLLFGFCLLLFL